MKLLHAADLHLDSPFAGLPPEEAAARRAGQRRLAAGICQLADRRGCDLLLLAGDIFDSIHPRPETVQTLQRAFAACRAEIFIAPGNHDYWTPDGPWAQSWPENVHIFSSAVPEAREIPDSGWTVWGAAFTGPSAPALLEGFHTDRPRSIMVLHGEYTRTSDYNPVSPEQAAASGLQYLALGHIHRRSGLQRAGGTRLAWPGCPEGRGFDECGQKGVLEITLDEGEDPRAVFLALPGARYETVSVDLTGGADPAAAVQAALPPDPRLHIRAALTGTVSEPLSSGRLAALQQALAPHYASLELSSQVQVSAAPDLQPDIADGTLRGLFLQALQCQWETADEARRAVLLEAARLGLAALDGQEVTDR